MTNDLTIISLMMLLVTLILVEILYSAYRQDDAYSFSGTVNNFLRGGVLILISVYLIHYFTLFFTHISNMLYQTTSPTTITTFLTALLFCDFMYYIFHRLHHKLPFLRKLHAVHHSDTKFNLSTAFRISWLEQSYIILFLTPLILVGFSPNLVFLSALFLVTYQLICHSHYLTLPKFLNYIFVTPTSHKVHHDEHIENQNSNYGAIFTIWDRMFNTYREQEGEQVFGIKGNNENNFIKIEAMPIINYFKQHHAKD